MTQVSRYEHMLKVTMNTMRMTVVARYRVEGSVLNDTVQGAMLGAETVLEIDSPPTPPSASPASSATPSAAASSCRRCSSRSPSAPARS
jgi:hypothetical protein